MTIRNDATRLRIPAKDPRRPRAVVARQGLALLDTDLDQQSRHCLERIEQEAVDILGSPGKLLVPAGNKGFQVKPGATPEAFTIDPGHGYLGGWLLENAVQCTLATQPHPRKNDVVASPALIGLKALVRYIDPVEEPNFADVALRDAQASGRSLVDWQVFPFALAGGGTATCAGDAAWQALIAPSTGTLTVSEQAAAASTDPCTLTPAGGFNRKENLLYRWEVHAGIPDAAFSAIDGPRFQLDQLQLKYSRRNASVMARITKIAGTEITVAAPPLDPRNWFAPGQFAEIVSVHDDLDPRNALATVRMYRVALAVDDRVVLEEKVAGNIAATQASADGSWFLRLWDAFPDGEGIAIVAATGGATASQAIDTGDGLSAKVGQGVFRRGDYWTCDARADGSFGWLKTGNVSQPMAPHGPEVRYASLGAMNGAANAITIDDCRVPFATLSDRMLLYRGGDGQGAFSAAVTGHAQLPAKLRVAVMRGETPVVGAQVSWAFASPPGSSCFIDTALCDATNSPVTVTDANGLCEVAWKIDCSRQADLHQVKASLVGATVPYVEFSAAFETAARTGYTPGNCPTLAGVTDVQTALDKLCAQISTAPKPKVLSLRAITLFDFQDKKTELIEEKLILNAKAVPERAFEHGIFFGFDAIPTMAFESFDPIAEIELDLPYPITDPDRLYWAQASTMATPNGKRNLAGAFGFQRVRLDGSMEKAEKGLKWMPSSLAAYFIESALQHHWGAHVTTDFQNSLTGAGWKVPPPIPRLILCRIRLRSARIWADTDDGRLYLNAEHLGESANVTKRELLLRDVDPQRAADLDMFIYLHRG